MKWPFRFLLLSVGFGLLFPSHLQARTIWNGPRITFTKANGTSATQAQNQDRITDTVRLTRANTQGIFNIAQESGYTSTSPAGTEWAFGTTGNLDGLTFRTWLSWHGGNPSGGPPTTVNRDAVLHLITEDIYIDIRFTSWTQRTGGGFAYTRSTPPEDAPPAFSQHPQSATVAFGADVTFTVAVSGSPAPTLQWRKGGQAIPGETGTSLVLENLTLDSAGSYDCVATNTAGTVTSNAATLTVIPPAAPTFEAQPTDMTARVGSGAFFSVLATGGGPTYQWRKDGADLAGETGSTLFLSDVQAASQGSYSCVVTNPGGSVTSDGANLTVVAEGSARLVNLSARALVGTGGDILIPGFVVSGSASKTLLVRAVGPRLGMPPFNVAGVLADPTMLLEGGNVVEVNDDWVLAPDPDALEAAAVVAGAFSLEGSDKDAAVLISLGVGAYTVRTSGVGNTTGVALVEVYDNDGGESSSRLVNLSARAQVGTGGDILIPGFVVEGNVAMTLLIRGVGPTLGAPPFNVPGVLSDPVMTIFRETQVAQNDDWQQAPNQPALVAATTAAGAFALGDGLADSAFLIALMPGAYTVQVAGKGGSTGVALVELYVVAP